MNFNLFKTKKKKKKKRQFNIWSHLVDMPRPIVWYPRWCNALCWWKQWAISQSSRAKCTLNDSFCKNQCFCTMTTTSTSSRNCCVGMSVCVPRRHRDSVHSLLESVESQYNPLSWSRCMAAKRRRRRRWRKKRRRKWRRSKRQNLTHQVGWLIRVMLCWLCVCVTWL